ncbi:hypothetical protein VNO78_23404 [Psophocarpus tetragonolobus]|uniref:Uncharacterized protein n=1 Tax=Psophocarpus tetragonolobus TaxID=3891 RepID=A0AAN9S3H1_PSOTE
MILPNTLITWKVLKHLQECEKNRVTRLQVANGDACYLFLSIDSSHLSSILNSYCFLILIVIVSSIPLYRPERVNNRDGHDPNPLSLTFQQKP